MSPFYKSRSFKEIGFSFIALFLLMNLLQTPKILFYFHSYLFFKIGFLVSLGVISVWVFVSVRDFLSKRGLFYYGVKKFKSLSIPAAAKVAIVFAFVGNLIAISWGAQRYPFYDVGMFRWPVAFKDIDKTRYEVKYYYWKQGQYKILELRKECSFFLAEHFGWGYSPDFAYATAYFHKGEKENFQFLSQAMRERGVDTLWVGVHSVNFETREVKFDPDICNAIRINQTAKLYYGPIYIPEYQMKKCDEY
jgi:hypothetical protein